MLHPQGSSPIDPDRQVQETCLPASHHQNAQYSSLGLLLGPNLPLSLVFRAAAEGWLF